ncbi:MAG: hypothetical protein II295_03845 [Akkermansia sp.]|nr:hypothetical protein [Akkermansia sp.]
MYKKALATVILSATCMAAPVIDNDALLTAGRRMVVVDAPEGHSLSGKAPAGKGAPFRILDGSNVLKELQAGEAFDVYAHSDKLYLVSENANNLNWQELQWNKKAYCTQPQSGKHKTVSLRSDEQKEADSRKDIGPALRRLLGDAALHATSQTTTTIELPKGEYHFYPEGALRMSYYISNHDQQDIQPVGLPLVGQKGLTINGNGSVFIFHGKMQPVLLMDSENVTLNDITIRHDNAYYNEGKIVEIKNGTTTLEYAPQFRWEVKNGRYYLTGDGEAKAPSAVLAFQKDGQMVPTGRWGDIGWPNKCEQVAPNRVRYFTDATKQGLKKGHILVQRHYGRPHPAMVLYRATNTTLNNVVFQDSQGMALIAQRSRDITINGGGCVCAPGRVHTASADATHFSNCAGTISVTNAMYEGMMDDAINVHSTCLQIEKLVSAQEVIARYMHPQAVGFEVFMPGERVQFIAGPTLENQPELATVKTVEKLDETHLRVTFTAPLPSGISTGYAMENADWYPAVNFIGCTVRHNRARGSLFTTPKPVLVKDCKFVASHGSAILLAGDAQGWYESGRCLDVKIINNYFEHNLTALYQFTEGIIAIYPMVNEPQNQQVRYHQNVLIEGNTFITHRVPLIYAISVNNLIFRNNKVTYDDKYPTLHGGTPYILKHCGKTDLQKL